MSSRFSIVHSVNDLGIDMDIITMYESAWKQQPGNEELAIQTFSANARTGNWKLAQQVRFRVITGGRVLMKYLIRVV